MPVGKQCWKNRLEIRLNAELLSLDLITLEDHQRLRARHGMKKREHEKRESWQLAVYSNFLWNRDRREV